MLFQVAKPTRRSAVYCCLWRVFSWHERPSSPKRVLRMSLSTIWWRGDKPPLGYGDVARPALRRAYCHLGPQRSMPQAWQMTASGRLVPRLPRRLTPLCQSSLTTMMARSRPSLVRSPARGGRALAKLIWRCPWACFLCLPSVGKR